MSDVERDPSRFGSVDKSDSINEVFRERHERFIPAAGEQLKTPTTFEVEVCDETLTVDYRVLDLPEAAEEHAGPNAEPVVVLQGFGSGWEGIAELGFSIASEGRKTILVSLPGEGNSDNPSEAYWNGEGFKNEAEVVTALIKHLKEQGVVTSESTHLVGHSQGSEVITQLAVDHPELVSSLVLLNPAGVREEDPVLPLATRFLASGAYTNLEFKGRLAFSGEDDYERALDPYIPKTKSPFAKDRLSQRRAEATKLASGHLLEKLQRISKPVTFIGGELDSVYPPGALDDASSQLARVVEAVQGHALINTSVMAELRHNTTQAPDEITAVNIDHYLEVAEKHNRGETSVS